MNFGPEDARFAWSKPQPTVSRGLVAYPKAISRSDHESRCAVLWTLLTRFCVRQEGIMPAGEETWDGSCQFSGSSAHKLQTQEAFMPGSTRKSYAIDSTVPPPCKHAKQRSFFLLLLLHFVRSLTRNTSEPMAQGPVWMICMNETNDSAG